MTWSRFDDLYDEHEKIEDAWFAFPPNPVGLHVMATTHCNRRLTDGVIDPRWLKRKLPKAKDYRRILDAMVEIELLDLLSAGETMEFVDSDGEPVILGPFDEDRYVVHDFLDRHDSRRQVKERRAKDAARQRQKRKEIRPESEPSPNGRPSGHHAESERSPARGARARARAGARIPTRPDPTRPTDTPQPPQGGGAGGLTPPKGKGQRARARFEGEVAATAERLFPGADVRKAQRCVRQATERLSQDGTKVDDVAMTAFAAQWWPELVRAAEGTA